jgi:autoinducer 2-degrading protein
VLIVIAQYRAQPGTADDIAEVLRHHAVSSAAEPGCLQFTALRSADDPDRFVLYESYVDEAAFDEHRATPHFRTNIEGFVAPRLAERSWSRYEVV